MTPDREWLETDGRGGFASGTAALARTRRYHALLMRAETPSRRFVLVNGFDAFVHTPDGVHALSAQHYQPGVTAPDGAARVERFTNEPWPTWTFRLPGGRAVRQEIFLPRGRAAAVVAFTLEGEAAGCRLEVRPFFSGRDPHALQRENGAFRFAPDQVGRARQWTPYAGVPSVVIATNGDYRHEPVWYRQFLYAAERARGLDDTEDLAAPGVFTWDLATPQAVLVLGSPATEAEHQELATADAAALAATFRRLELDRRALAPSALHRAAEDYVVRRGAGHTIMAGYPWFTDWGRDTFIALRGLCLAPGRLDEARSILLEWSGVVSEGMLPNFFPDGAAQPEYNSVDASLWYVVAVHDYLASLGTAGRPVDAGEQDRLAGAVTAILEGYARGTRFGIRADTDGLLFAGQAGVQLTWMDARVGDWVVTPRIGKPVEVQALWINALRIGARFDPKWAEFAARAQASFERRFWNAAQGGLFDVVDADFVPGRDDASLRPNQIFAVGGLPFPVLTGARAAQVVQTVERELLTPLGLRTLARGHPDYRPHYRGGVVERDGAYHQGTVWPWLIGPFVEAWVRVNGDTNDVRAAAAARFLTPLRAHLREAGLGHVSEVADAEPPHTPGGCPFQAWSLGELLRLELIVLAARPDPARRVEAPAESAPTPASVPRPVKPARAAVVRRDAREVSVAWSANFLTGAPEFYRL